MTTDLERRLDAAEADAPTAAEPKPRRKYVRKPKEATPNGHDATPPPTPGTELVLRNGNALAAQVFFSEASLNLPEKLTIDAYRELTPHFARAHRCLMWWVGDYMLFGEKHFGEKLGEGTGILDSLGYAPLTLKQCLLVARSFPPDQRNPHLTFAHHVHVMGLSKKDRKFWLDKAEAENMNTRELKRAVEEATGKTKAEAPAAAPAKAKAAPAEPEAEAEDLEEAEEVQANAKGVTLSLLTRVDEADKAFFDQMEAAKAALQANQGIDAEGLLEATKDLARHLADLLEVMTAK